MKRSTLSAMLVASLLLSHQAQCADTESAKGPLTAAEKAQCRTQIAEYNQHVLAYNAQLDALKGLEAEIDALSAELGKEKAVVDRRNDAAMDALNARIGKNNELVAQHEQMGASIKTRRNENDQLAAKFREECENRPLAAPVSLKSQPSKSQSSDALCSSATGATDAKRQIEATFVEMRADEKQHQAKLERVAQEQAKAQSWSKEKQGKFWMQLIASPKFAAFEREKRPYVMELMSVLGSRAKNGQEECRLTQRIAATLPAIKAINARQYAYMADEIRAAK